MARQSNSISLPWSRRGGVLVAELGAVFTVELAEEGWQCSVENGECVEVLGTGLKSQRQGKARAEEHATRMAAEALAEKAPKGRARRMPPGRKPAGRLAAPAEKPDEGSTPAPKPRGGAPKPADAKPADAKPADTKPADAKPADMKPGEITFDEIEDGCIMGRAGGACWVANEKEVAWTKDVDPKLQAQVEQAAARYYRQKREAKAAERAAAREQREATKRAAREKKQAAAEKRAAQEAAKAAPAKKTSKKATTKKTAAKKTAKTAGKKAAAKRAPAEEGETSTTAKTVARTAKKGPRGRKGKAAGKDAAKEDEVVRVKTTEKQTKGPIAWTNQDGGLRGTAAHGTFLVQPEGSRHALYFYEPGGQSRFLQSGTLCDMRKAAEEMAARGQPAPSSEKISPEMEAQMMQMFVTGAVGGNSA